jgi:hypothetical protein
MALSVSVDAGLMGNPSMEAARSRNMSFYLGRLTGTYGGAVTTLTIPISTPYFVSIPPASGYMFEYNHVLSMFGMRRSAATDSAFVTCNTSIDLSSFSAFWNGTTSCGLPFVAFGWG